MRFYSPSRRDTTRRLASPVRWGVVSNTAATGNVQHSKKEGSFDKPAAPRMSGALPASPGTVSWNLEPDTARGDRFTPLMSGALPASPEAGSWGCGQPTSRARSVGFNNDNGGADGDFVEDYVFDTWGAASHLCMMNSEDAVVGSKESAVSNDVNDTWEECGLRNRKTGKAMRDSPTGRHDSNYNNADAWGDSDSPKEHPGNWGNWNKSARAHGQGTATTSSQRRTSAADCWRLGDQTFADGNWYVGNQASHAAIPVITCNEGYGPAPQDFVSQRQYQTNYDGNRAGLEGSRVFYSAILPTVPTLRDIGNHAEYTAWFDMLRSILKYHQLTSVIASDANRPNGYKEGRRWDQDRLRAAIIIKGALSFEVFWRVRRNGWSDTENPTETVEKVRATHGTVCPCGHSQGMSLLDF